MSPSHFRSRTSWLYHRHNMHGLVTRSWGRRPVCLISVGMDRPGYKQNWILQVGAISVSWGPSGGVEEGRASIPDELMRWGHIWWYRDGVRALAIDWTRA